MHYSWFKKKKFISAVVQRILGLPAENKKGQVYKYQPKASNSISKTLSKTKKHSG